MLKTFLISLLLHLSLTAHSQKFRISGSVTDSTSGEVLPYAGIRIKSARLTSTANAYGYYSVLLEKGTHEIEVSYVGYRKLKVKIDAKKNVVQDLRLVPFDQQLEEVQVNAGYLNADKDLIPGKGSISVAQVKKMPTLGGEADILHALQYLPGIRAAVEGTTGLSVRGGSFDQTLIALDDAPVYNASHALGFYSTFNPDAIKSIDIYKGLIPAQFGGRLSSVVDLKMREGNNQELKVSGGIGLIASRLTAEGPLIKNRSSFILSGRYSYAGIIANKAGELAEKINLGGFQKFPSGNDIRFYDLNGKLNWKSKNSKNQFFLSGYSGRDWFKYYLFERGTFTKWQNTTASLRWNHVFSQNLFSNTTVYYSRYRYDYSLVNDRRDFEWKAGLSETGVKNEVDYFINDKSVLKAGFNLIHTAYQPGAIKPKSASSIIRPFELDSKQTGQIAVFAGLNKHIASRLSTYLGIRFSTFALLGPGTLYQYEKGYAIDSMVHDKGVMDFRWAAEPRFSLNYAIDSIKVLSLALSRSKQFVHLLTNSSVGLPTDIWFPSNKNVGPQSSSLISLGYKQTMPVYILSIESYYKDMNGVIDFVDNADLFINQYVESQIRSGKGRAYGVETLIEKRTGKLTGWLTYTLAKTDRTIDGINGGTAYPTRYDRRHSVSLVSAYQVKKGITFSADFQYNSGGAATLPAAVYEFQAASFNYYSGRNGFRLPSFHRLDFQVTFIRKKRWGERQWVFGVYNAYNRRNLFSAEVIPKDDNYLNTSFITAVSLYGVVPSVAYNFKF